MKNERIKVSVKIRIKREQNGGEEKIWIILGDRIKNDNAISGLSQDVHKSTFIRK